MFKQVSTGVVFAMVGSAAFAGGIERHAFSSGFLFEEGSYVEFSFGAADPSVSGTVGVPSGDMSAAFTNLALAYKRDLTDRLSFGLVLDQPFGANVAYPASAAPYPFAGTTATLRSTALTGVLKYDLETNFSVYGGLRAEQVSGDVALRGLITYDLGTSTSTEVGYLAGVAWEKPEIAARVALTYESERTHEFDATENNTPTTTFESTFPQTLTLEFQTGVAEDTLLFGSVRWAEWSVFDINPPVGPELVAYDDNRVTYNLGLGRRFSDTWSGAVLIGHEPSTGSITGNLGPTDGFSYVGLAATYTKGGTKITGGIRYTDLGNATTQAVGASFTNNSAISAGLRISYNY